eukprot:Gregarina_sp_Poly_1__734@NODE_1175_length_4862_cov_1212_086131_g805_i0_p2_GENE_NODE_1175_length_4862_cov_1212_086131_g805_i0NODE_1175_length_4862_cov_1212_086131_g805_i0_p2_ORF_typecomplete_len508_score63_41Fer4_14/PF13394_6/7_2e12Radical_SAM/PF04055_21/3e09Fer4_12/PF13353_6/1_3e04Fer4_12/PF13353_6/0_037Focadhesin/PF11229_8/4_6e03Focadhesin/PF11229_8/0_15_NODE_1175_length_4862_cov_1212_086131_g805_i029994522
MDRSLGRRGGLKHPSCLDFTELRSRFLEGPSIVSRAQLDAFIRACVCSDTAVLWMDRLVHDTEEGDREALQEEIDWQSICPDLPQKFYLELREQGFRLMTTNIVKISFSEKNDTCKILLSLQDNRFIETCLMRFGNGKLPGHRRDTETGQFSSKVRATVCVSSQIGCKMGCSFCATGTLGLKGNLTSAEILEQITVANVIERRYRLDEDQHNNAINMNRWLRNVVFMGMGEPLDNYDEVIRTVKILTSQHVLGFAPSRITISTVGHSTQRIRCLAADVPRVSLALSLHAPTQELRAKLVPSALRCPLNELMQACFEFVHHQKELSKSNAKRQVLFIEYCLLAGVNDTPECVEQLDELLHDHLEDSIINVIPYNPTDTHTEYQTPSDERVKNFVKQLRSRKLRVFVRHEFGREIEGACGQLAAKQTPVSSELFVSNETVTSLMPREKSCSLKEEAEHAGSNELETAASSTVSVVGSELNVKSAVLLAGVSFVVGVGVGRWIWAGTRSR